MPKPTKGPRIGGSPSHQRIIMANLASQLFEHGRITTTEPRARRVQPLAEKLITKAKRGDLHARRTVMRTITDPTVVHVLFTEIAPAVAGREGGCTRITKLGPRKGDNAPMALIELVTEPLSDTKVRSGAKPETTGGSPRASKPAADTTEAAVEQATTAAAEAGELIEDIDGDIVAPDPADGDEDAGPAEAEAEPADADQPDDAK